MEEIVFQYYKSVFNKIARADNLLPLSEFLLFFGSIFKSDSVLTEKYLKILFVSMNKGLPINFDKFSVIIAKMSEVKIGLTFMLDRQQALTEFFSTYLMKHVDYVAKEDFKQIIVKAFSSPIFSTFINENLKKLIDLYNQLFPHETITLANAKKKQLCLESIDQLCLKYSVSRSKLPDATLREFVGFLFKFSEQPRLFANIGLKNNLGDCFTLRNFLCLLIFIGLKSTKKENYSFLDARDFLENRFLFNLSEVKKLQEKEKTKKKQDFYSLFTEIVISEKAWKSVELILTDVFNFHAENRTIYEKTMSFTNFSKFLRQLNLIENPDSGVFSKNKLKIEQVNYIFNTLSKGKLLNLQAFVKSLITISEYLKISRDLVDKSEVASIVVANDNFLLSFAALFLKKEQRRLKLMSIKDYRTLGFLEQNEFLVFH